MRAVHIWGALILLILPLAAADLQLTQAGVHAPSVEQGAQITLTYTLDADTELGRVSTDVYLPGGINHRDVRTIDARTYQHQQTFELPRDYDGDEEILVRVDTPNEQPVTARFTLQRPSQRQAPIQPTTTSQAPVAVLVDPVRDVVPGDSIYYRAQIINTGNQPTTATIGLSDVSSWATYRVDPSRTQRLAPGERQDVYIYLEADQDASPGTKYFDVTATHAGNTQAATVKLAVLKPIETRNSYAPWIIAAALILLAAAIIFVVASYIRDNNDNNGGDDDDFITYY